MFVGLFSLDTRQAQLEGAALADALAAHAHTPAMRKRQ
jgi:hypothetical protein